VRALGLLLLAATVAAQDPEAPAFERAVEVPGPGLFAVRLDAHVYEAARPDLGDLRVVDAAGGAVPYVLDRGALPPGPARRPRMRNRGHLAGGVASVVLDFGERVHKQSLTVRSSGANFRRRVTVEGSDDGQSWTTLTDGAWVFAVPGADPGRYEELSLPRNDFSLLRVRVHPGDDERSPVSIEEAWVPGGVRAHRREERIVPRWSRADDPASRETWLTLELGARYQPFDAVELEVEDERFFREARLEAREEPRLSPSDPVAPADRWRPVGQGVVYRLRNGGNVRECLRLPLTGRGRVLRLRLLNRDDRPLRVSAVGVLAPVERLLLEDGRGPLVLTYGAPALGAPRYDLGRTLDPPLEVPLATLGPPLRRDVVADVLPWTERHPALLWVGLLVVVAALGTLTWRALRSV
jgi:hypothetical protein